MLALSSGEAEYYGMVWGGSNAIGYRTLMLDFGVQLRFRIKTDASAAKSIANRRGLGKIRHLEVTQLWLQDKVTRGDIEVEKVKGEVNWADCLTKPLDGGGVMDHLTWTGQVVTEGRHNLAPKTEQVGTDAP